MAKNSCIVRVENLLKKSSIKSIKKQEIINAIKDAMAEKKLSSISEVDVDAVAKDVTAQMKAQKQKNKINAIKDEILIRKYQEHVLTNFANNEFEGLASILVGSNDQIAGARDSVSVAQNSAMANLVTESNNLLKQAGVFKLFKDMDVKTQRIVTRTIAELAAEPTLTEQRAGIKPRITEQNPDIIKVAKIMHEFSEKIRQTLNSKGANIPKMWGWVVKQSNDIFEVRSAANRLGLKLDDIKADPDLIGTDINYNKNYQAWKNFAMQGLDGDRTFATTDNIDSYMRFIYNTLVGNKIQMSDAASNIYGSKDFAKGAGSKRVLHYKTADDWFNYHLKFGTGTLQEAYYSGIMTAGRNIGMIDKLGTKPLDNFEKIRLGVQSVLAEAGRDTSKIKSFQPFKKWMNQIDGSAHTPDNFVLAKWGAIGRGIGNISKLGGATPSAIADLALYGSEMKHQGDVFLGSMADAMAALAKIRQTPEFKDIAEGSGFMIDGVLTDMASRSQVGDNLSRDMTKVQRTFFELNLLTWWTNTLKENAMLGMSNYYAKQKNLKLNELNKPLQNLFNVYNINSVKWDVIRTQAMIKASNGKEFLNISKLDNISDLNMEKILGRSDLSKTELQIQKTNFKYSVSGILIDRSIHAVIQPDARVRGVMTQGLLKGTAMGEAMAFLGQFKGFPMALVNMVGGRDMGFIKKGPNQDIGRGIRGMGATFVTLVMMGYVAMSLKDLLKGKNLRDPRLKSTWFAAAAQGGGLGIYGDVLFREQRNSSSIVSGLVGPGATTVADVLLAVNYGIRGEGGAAGKAAYRAVSQNIPFANLFYIKAAFDYIIGYQMMETISPGVLKRVEKRMKKEYNQEYLFTKPSITNKGF
jgi:hypothetical protein